MEDGGTVAAFLTWVGRGAFARLGANVGGMGLLCGLSCMMGDIFPGKVDRFHGRRTEAEGCSAVLIAYDKIPHADDIHANEDIAADKPFSCESHRTLLAKNGPGAEAQSILLITRRTFDNQEFTRRKQFAHGIERLSF